MLFFLLDFCGVQRAGGGVPCRRISFFLRCLWSRFLLLSFRIEHALRYNLSVVEVSSLVELLVIYLFVLADLDILQILAFLSSATNSSPRRQRLF